MNKRFIGLFKNGWFYFFFAAAALLTLYMNVYISRTLLDGDASLMLYRGYLLAKKGFSGLTDIWGMNEVRLFDISLIFAPFFKLTQNWTLVRIGGTVLMQAIYCLSFMYLLSQIGLSKRTQWVAAGMLLMPFSTAYARIVLYHLHYCAYITYIFLILGLIFQLMNLKTFKQRKAVFPFCALGLLWIVVGANGVRHLMILLAPLLALNLVHIVQLLRNYTFERGRVVGKQPIQTQPEIRLLALLLYSFVFFCIGFAINRGVLVSLFHGADFATTSFAPVMDGERCARIVNLFLSSIGFRHSAESVMSIRGISLAAALLSFGYLAYTSWTTGFIRKNTSDHYIQSVSQGLMTTALMLTIFTFLFVPGYDVYELYCVPVIVLAFPVLAVEVERLGQSGVSCAKKLLIYLTCLAFVFQGGYTTAYLLDKKDSKLDTWGGLSNTNVSIVQDAQDCVDFMLTFGYTHGMIYYWHAAVMVELSDAQLAIAPLWGIPSTGDTRLTDRSAFLPENLPDKIIVFVPPDWIDSFTHEYPDCPEVFSGSVFTGYEAQRKQVFPE